MLKFFRKGGITLLRERDKVFERLAKLQKTSQV